MHNMVYARIPSEVYIFPKQMEILQRSLKRYRLVSHYAVFCIPVSNRVKQAHGSVPGRQENRTDLQNHENFENIETSTPFDGTSEFRFHPQEQLQRTRFAYAISGHRYHDIF